MTKPLVTDASNKEQVKKAEQKVELQRDRELNDIRAITATVEGRRFIWRLLTQTKMFESPFHLSGSVTNLNIGQQDIGRFVFAEINNADKAIFMTMQQESEKGIYG